MPSITGFKSLLNQQRVRQAARVSCFCLLTAYKSALGICSHWSGSSEYFYFTVFGQARGEVLILHFHSFQPVFLKPPTRPCWTSSSVNTKGTPTLNFQQWWSQLSSSNTTQAKSSMEWRSVTQLLPSSCFRLKHLVRLCRDVLKRAWLEKRSELGEGSAWWKTQLQHARRRWRWGWSSCSLPCCYSWYLGKNWRRALRLLLHPKL